MLRLEWALEEAYFHFCDLQMPINVEQIENTILQIMESEIIDSADYVTSGLFKKLKEVIEAVKKKKRSTLKNYLLQRQTMIVNGFEKYLKNYSLFLNVARRF